MTDNRTHGTLTAEQVREAIERHVKFYEGGDYDEQAIADELNAMLGSGKRVSEAIAKLRQTVRDAFGKTHISMLEEGNAIMRAIDDVETAELGCGTCKVTRDFKCSNCGNQIGTVSNCVMFETCDGRQEWKSLDNEICDIPNYCPHCGAKVIDTEGGAK